MKEWEAGHFLALFDEAKAGYPPTQFPQQARPIESQLRKFAEFVIMSGKVKAATHLITEENHSCVLPLNHVVEGKTVLDILQDKPHPPSCPIDAVMITPPTLDPTPSHVVLFDKIDGLSILRSVQNTEGGAGPSGVDVCLWRRT